MRRMLLAVFAAGLSFALGGVEPAAAFLLSTSIDLEYGYSQTDLGGDVNAETLFNQKYQIKYETALSSAYDFVSAVRLDLQDSWFTDQASTSRVAPTLEMSAKGSRLAAKAAFEEVISSTDVYRESGEVTSYSTSVSFDLEMTPVLWPEVKLRYQRRGDYEDYAREGTSNSYELSTRKDIYGLRLELNLKHDDAVSVLPERTDSTTTQWSAKATYKKVLWGRTEFEVAYEINESYADDYTRDVFTKDTSSYSQLLKTRLKNSLVLAPRITLGLVWEYQYEQDLLAVDFDYKLKNKYAIDLRWDAYSWLKITSEARRDIEMLAAAPGEDDVRSVADSFKLGFDMTSISWLQLAGKAELTNDGDVVANTGGSVDRTEAEKYELIAKNRIGDFWDLTMNAITSNEHTDKVLTKRETKVKTTLKLKWYDLTVTPAYEVSRTNEWEREFDFPISQNQIRDARIRFEYVLQLTELYKASFSHEYGVKVDDTLDEVLNFERQLQFNESTRLNVLFAEIFRDMRLEGEIERRASDTEDDADPELVELSYVLKLDWKRDQLSVLSSIKYNDKGDTFDDVSFNAKASWKSEQLELTGEYQFDKIIKDVTEPKDEKRTLSLKLNYKF